MSGSVDIVIVNWNAGAHLRECLASIARAERRHATVRRVTVVDNASSDGSADGLEDLPLPLGVMRNGRNAGFAVACNQGARGSVADFLLFLNPDTLLAPETLDVVVRFMEGDTAADVGICGVRILRADGRPAISCARFPTLRVLIGKMTGLDRVAPALFPRHHLDDAELQTSRPVDQVIGAFFFVRRDLFEELGGFDERYFIYFEEVDFALRARGRGVRSFFVREASAVHVENVSTDQVPDVRLYHSLRSRFIFAYRHWPAWQARACVAASLLVELPARLCRALLRRSARDVRFTLAGYRLAVADLLGRSGLPVDTPAVR